MPDGSLPPRAAGDPPHRDPVLGSRVRRSEVPRARKAAAVERVGCTVVASEGLRNAVGEFSPRPVATRSVYAQLGGVVPGARRTRQAEARLQGPLAFAGLPAALGAPPRLEDRRQAYAVISKVAVEYALPWSQRGDARDRADVRFAVSLEDRAVGEDREPREEAAQGFISRDGYGITHRRTLSEPLIRRRRRTEVRHDRPARLRALLPTRRWRRSWRRT